MERSRNERAQVVGLYRCCVGRMLGGALGFCFKQHASMHYHDDR